MAARIHAATYELLVLLREFDQRTGWNNGFVSCAHWLHWRTGIALGAAREKVRVAHALAALPLVSATMQRGDDLLRQGASADPRGYARERGGAAGASRRPGPPHTWSGWSAPGGA